MDNMMSVGCWIRLDVSATHSSASSRFIDGIYIAWLDGG